MPAHDVEITGTFSINSYKLVYRVDGVEYKTYTLEYGATIAAEVAPTKEGYTFSGWSDIPATMPDHDVIVTGSFSVNSYKLVYKVDGQVYKTYTLEYGATIAAEVAPTKEGYTFSGWSEIPAVMPANDVEVTGTFSINSYKLIYIVDGEIYKTLTVEYGAAITAEADPTKEGATFSGWSEIPATMPAKDVTVTGSFGNNIYSIIYSIDGEFYKNVPMSYGAEITPEENPTKEGYTFSGWSEIPATMPAHNVEVTGSFIANSYNLTYKVDGQEYKTYAVIYGTAIIAEPDPVKEGYTFSGWSEIPATMPAFDVEVTGSFTVNMYLLTVIVDGVLIYSDSVAFGTRLADYVNLIMKAGIDLTQWELYDKVDILTMPAHDVLINTMSSAVRPVIIDSNESEIYDLRGRRIETNDASILPPGIYIRSGNKFIVR